MGMISSSQSFCRFTVDVPYEGREFLQWVTEMVLRYRFNEALEGLGLKVGWTSCFHPFSNELKEDDFWLPPFVVLSMRVEERRVPRGLIKKYCALEEEKLRQEKGLRRLSRKAIRKIREEVEFSLLQKTIPVPFLYDVAWDTEEGVVYFFSISQKAMGLFQEFFSKSFGIVPRPIIPYTLAEMKLGTKAVEAIIPEIFA